MPQDELAGMPEGLVECHVVGAIYLQPGVKVDDLVTLDGVKVVIRKVGKRHAKDDTVEPFSTAQIVGTPIL